MKSYLGLIPQYERVHRKNNRISILCIMLSVCLVMAIFSMADMAMRSQKNYFIKTNGEYHAALHDVDEETAQLVSARVDVALSGWVYQGSTGMLSGKTVSFVGADEKTMESLTEMNMTDGVYPSLPDEALLNESAMEQLGLSIGDNMTVTVPDGSQKQYRITGTLADMGSIQLAGSGSDETVSAVRNLFPPDSSIADKRLSNSESQSSYYTGAVFIYGFLLIIALITVFNIFNSMNASVAARTRQYGVMRSIGMGAGQLYKMIAAEAVTYAVLGCVTGCVLGLPLNKMMFQFLIAGKWGTSWQLPAVSLLLIVVLCFGSAALAIRRPIKKIGKLSIVETIKLQQ